MHVHILIHSLFHPQTFPEHLHSTPTACAELCWGPGRQSSRSTEGTRRSPRLSPRPHYGHTILWPLSPENFTSRPASPEDFFWNTPSKHQVLATLSPPLWRPVSDLITYQLKTEKESCLLLFTAHSLLKRTWGSWMKVVDGRKESPTSQKWAASFCLPNERPRLLNLSERQRDWLCHLELVGVRMLTKPCEDAVSRIFTKGHAPWPVT